MAEGGALMALGIALFVSFGITLPSGANAASCVSAPSGLVGWWPGDAGANDIAGTNNGTLLGGAAVTNAGFVSSALTFDGTNSYVQIPDSLTLRPTNLTIEAWVKFKSLDSAGVGAANGRQYIVFKQNTNANSIFEGYDLGKTRVTGGDVFKFIVSSGSGQSVGIQSTTMVSVSTWYHIAAVRGSNFTQLYVNGQLERQTNVTFPQNYGDYPLYFGSSGLAIWDRKFSGILDEVSLYNRALSSNDIASIYAAGAAGKCKVPVITSQPQSQAVLPGWDANFTVSAAGSPPLAYQWRHFGTNIAIATDSFLYLTNVQTVDAGNYDVVITNFAGSATSSVAVLTVDHAPYVSASASPTVGLPPLNVTFSSAGSFDPDGTAITYYWDFGDGSSSTNANPNHTYSAVGTYYPYLAVSDGLFASSFSGITINVMLPPAITGQPQSRTNGIGTSTTFGVTVSGSAPLSYQWQKNSTPISGATNSSYTINSVQLSDAASYEVVVTNAVGSATSAKAVLTVLSSPPNDMFVNRIPIIGLSASTNGFNANSTKESGEPNHAGNAGGSSVWWKWTASTNAAVTLDTIGSSFDTLLAVYTGSSVATLTSVASDDDSGGNGTSKLTFVAISGTEYEIAVDGYGGLSGNITLNLASIPAPPQITSQPQSQTVTAGTTATFNVNAVGAAPLRYQWRKAGNNVANATNSSYTIINVQTNHAGTYSVLVSNSFGSATSVSATLTVVNPPGNDAFAAAFQLTGLITNVTGNNISATKEAGEPDHAGDSGGHSVWWRWTAPTNGWATVNTIGSSFDTLLAVYTGLAVSNLFLVASDDEDGGNHTSQVTFQASSGAAYQIAVDGWLGAAGSVVLQLVELAGAPQFIKQPSTQTVTNGWYVNFTAAATGSPPLSYQWQKNGVAIPDATQTSYPDYFTNTFYGISPVYLVDSGNYTVIASNSFGVVTSAVAVLTIVSGPVNDMYSNAIPISGLVTNVTGSNVGSTSEAFEQYSGRSVWWAWTAPSNGTVLVDTFGSSFSPALTIYTNSVAGPQLVIALGDSGRFDAIGGTSYQISVGSSWQQGIIALHVQEVFLAPQITIQPQAVWGQPGINASFGVGADGTQPFTYQWRKDGTNIAGATATSYSVLSATTASNGLYSVVVSNLFGSAASSNAELSVYPVPTNDLFSARTPLSGLSNSILADNVGAGKEANEPDHAGDSGGSSVWWTWKAPASGVAIISTGGSSFDTLLAVYTGASVSNLTLVASNKASPGSQSSTLSFNTVANTDYQIAVDGAYHAGPDWWGAWEGTIALSVQLFTHLPPFIVQQPIAKAVLAAHNTSFNVIAGGSLPLQYQWLFKGAKIANGTNASLFLTNVAMADAGMYSVMISNLDGSVTSATASLLVDPPVVPDFKANWPGLATGPAYDVQVAGDFAYVATGASLVILDVSDRGRPRRVGGYYTDGEAVKIGLKEGYVYLLTQSNQFLVPKLSRIDAHNPAVPTKVAECNLAGLASFTDYKLGLVGEMIWVRDQQLRIIDTNCNVLVSIPVQDGASFSAGGRNLYIYNSVLFDLTAPNAPEAIADLETAGFFERSEVANGFMYSFGGAGWSDTLSITDVSNPGHFRTLCHTLIANGQLSYGGISSLEISSNTLYGLEWDYTGNAIGIVDTSEPWQPQLIGSLIFSEGAPRSLRVVNNYGYVAAGQSGLMVFDVSDPANIFRKGQFFTAVQANGISLQGNIAYVFDSGTGFHLVDVGDPEAPVWLGTYQSLRTPGAVAAAGRYVYVGVNAPGTSLTNLPPAMEVVDVSNPTNSHAVARIDLPNLPLVGDHATVVTAIAVNDGRAVVTTFNEGLADLTVLDVSIPTAPKLTSRLSLSGINNWANNIVLHQDLAYVTLAQGSLVIVDLSNPGNPRQVVDYETPDSVASIHGGMCFLSSGNGTIALDVSQPSAPVLVGSNGVSGELAWLRGNTAVASDGDSVEIFDFTDLGNPLEIGRYDGISGSLASDEQHVFVAAGGEGLLVLDLGPAFASAPNITSPPQNCRVLPATTTNFFVGVNGTVPIQYQWRFNNVDIPGATQPLLTLADIHADQAGNYSVVVTNSVGSTTSSIAVLSVDALPVVTLTSPESSNVFFAPATVSMSASAVDPDTNGWVAQVAFYTNQNLFAVISNTAPYTNTLFSATLSNLPLGNYTLSLVATDNEGGTSSTIPITIIVTNTPVFQFSRSNYIAYERDGEAVVTVRRNADIAANVNLATSDLTAIAVGNGGPGNYYATTTNVLFAPGTLDTNVNIRLVNDGVYRGNKEFKVTLSNPQGGTLTYPSAATVTIIDDDDPSTTNSFTDVRFPGAASTDFGSIQVFLTPDEAMGAWRFTWETAWRASGNIASNLPPTDASNPYVIDFLPRNGFVTPTPRTDALAAGNPDVLTNNYDSDGGNSQVGSINVTLLPVDVQSGTNRGHWHLKSEADTNWYDSGTVISSLPAGNHIVEFTNIPGGQYETPAPVIVAVTNAMTSAIQATYLAASPVSTIALPVVLGSFTDIAAGLSNGLPYAFNGQLISEAGYGSGFVVKRHTVLTAAHVVFDAANLVYVDDVRWYFQRHSGAYEPIPQTPIAQTPRSRLILAGYAAARAADTNLPAGQSSSESRNLDVAALAFLDDAGRGGQGGYLVSATNGTEWLELPGLKLLLGYPMDSVPGPEQGKLHYVGPGPFQFESYFGQLYRSYNLASYAGNSGGPMCVQVFATANPAVSSFFIPAGVYLGGNSNQTIIRAIDLDVADLINQAEASSAPGGNGTSGGVTLWGPVPPGGGQYDPGVFKVSFTPASVSASASWHVKNSNSAWNNDTVDWYYPTNPGLFTIEFSNVTHYTTAPDVPVTVTPGAPTSVIGAYTLMPAQLGVTPAAGLTADGYPGGPLSFVSASTRFTLTNLGGSNFIWRANTRSNWLTLSPTTGQLGFIGSMNLTVSLSPTAFFLTNGTYADTINFTNQNNGSGNTIRTVKLSVVSLPILTNARVLSNGAMVITLQGGRTNHSYAILTNSNLLNPISTWKTAQQVTHFGINGQALFTNPPPGTNLPLGSARQFFRARENPN
jgi:PKD repeat protein